MQRLSGMVHFGQFFCLESSPLVSRSLCEEGRRTLGGVYYRMGVDENRGSACCDTSPVGLLPVGWTDFPYFTYFTWCFTGVRMKLKL